MKRWIALAAVALPILVLFGPALFSDRLFAMRDAGHYYYPLFKWCADEWGAGRVPLWNPLENCGTAIHADPTAGLWYPGKLIFALPLEFSICFKLYIVGHVVLAAATSYWLARKWGASIYGSALAALSYSCGGSVVFQHCNVVYLVGAAWLPVAMGLIDDIFRTRRIRSAVWLAVVLALMVLGGDPQMAYHVVLLSGLYWLVLVSSRIRVEDEHANPNSERGKHLLTSIALALAAAALALLLAAVQIFPSQAASQASPRAEFANPRSVYEVVTGSETHDLSGDQIPRGLFGTPQPGTHHALVYDFSVAPWRLLECLAPNLSGRMFPQHRRWLSLWPAEGRVWTPSLYAGLLPLLLGLGVFGLGATALRLRWLSWAVIFFTLGSFGTFGLGWLVRQFAGWQVPIGDPVGGAYWLFVVCLPNYIFFRYPAKLLVVAACGLSLLAAFGWDRLVGSDSPRLRFVFLAIGCCSGLAAIGALVAGQFLMLGRGAVDPAFGPFDSGGVWFDVVGALVHTAVVALTSWCLLSKAVASQHSLVSQSLLLLFCAAELTVANYWLIPTAPAHLWRSASPLALAVESPHEPARVYVAPRWWPPSFAEASSSNRMAQIVAWERATLAGRYGLLDRLAIVNSQVGMKSAAHERLLAPLARSSFAADDTVTWQAVDRLGIEYLVLPESITPAFAARVTVPDLPSGAALWRINRSRSDGRVEARVAAYTPDFGPLIGGGIASGVGWILLAGFVVWQSLRRKRALKSSSSAPA